jgi:DNA-binding winged helix-turn-helix (wHTH) protein
MTLRFSRCTLDLEARRLFRDNQEVRLSPKAFEALRVLVENRPRAMSKTELLERVWPDVFVSDASLARVINEIRDALDDTARNGRIVRTVHAFGYAFVAEVQSELPRRHTVIAAPSPMCWLISSTRAFQLREGEQIAGRDPDIELCLDSPKVSWRHARILVDGTHATIEDMASKNGTFVRGTRITELTVLNNGDEVRIGQFQFVFRVEETPPSTETEVLSRNASAD